MKKLIITSLLFTSLFALGQQKRMLSLEECIDIAVENNLTVQRSELNLTSSEISLMQAKAARYPNLNAGGSYGYSWGRGIDPTTNQFTTQRIGFNGLNASSGVTLINGFQINNTIKQSRLNQEASEYDLLKAINDISLNTSLNYLNVIFNKELLENSRFVLESSKEQLSRTEKLVESGALPISNELQLISQVATNEVNLINAENNLDLAVLALKQGLLLPPGEEIDIVIPEIEVDQAEVEGNTVKEVYEVALANQPEIQSADLRVESARAGVEVANGGMLPSLSLNGSLNTNYSDLFTERFVSDGSVTIQENVPTGLITANNVAVLQSSVEIPNGSIEEYGVFDQYSDNLSKRLSLNLSVPIFNGFQTKANIQRSKITQQQAEISATETRNVLYQTIESSYRNALAAAKTYSASQRQVEALEETFRALENQYNLGASNFTDFQVASNNLFQAQTDLSRAKYDFIFKLKVLEFYQGKKLTF
ncbi:MAG: TolC family protein [Ekhidna sp.]